jgi:tripartite-type tricarboxylate transporter receptor subunit TctC
MAIRPTLFKQRPFDPLTDFVPISHYVKSPFVFIVNPSLPVRSVPEFIKYAKDRPGQISYSSSGIRRSTPFDRGTAETEVRFRYGPCAVPKQSAIDRRCRRRSCRRIGCRGGRFIAADQDGKLRALAVTSATRFPTLPDVPPLAEAVGMPTSRQCRGTSSSPATTRRATS